MQNFEGKIQEAKLVPFKRPNGDTYYCFSELKIKFFKHVPLGTIKSWLRALNITKETCRQEEREFYTAVIPNIAVGAFKLISHQNTLRLLEHCHNRVINL